MALFVFRIYELKSIYRHLLDLLCIWCRFNLSELTGMVGWFRGSSGFDAFGRFQASQNQFDVGVPLCPIPSRQFCHFQSCLKAFMFA